MTFPIGATITPLEKKAGETKTIFAAIGGHNEDASTSDSEYSPHFFRITIDNNILDGTAKPNSTSLLDLSTSNVAIVRNEYRNGEFSYYGSEPTFLSMGESSDSSVSFPTEAMLVCMGRTYGDNEHELRMVVSIDTTYSLSDVSNAPFGYSDGNYGELTNDTHDLVSLFRYQSSTWRLEFKSTNFLNYIGGLLPDYIIISIEGLGEFKMELSDRFSFRYELTVSYSIQGLSFADNGRVIRFNIRLPGHDDWIYPRTQTAQKQTSVQIISINRTGDQALSRRGASSGSQRTGGITLKETVGARGLLLTAPEGTENVRHVLFPPAATKYGDDMNFGYGDGVTEEVDYWQRLVMDKSQQQGEYSVERVSSSTLNAIARSNGILSLSVDSIGLCDGENINGFPDTLEVIDRNFNLEVIYPNDTLRLNSRVIIPQSQVDTAEHDLITKLKFNLLKRQLEYVNDKNQLIEIPFPRLQHLLTSTLSVTSTTYQDFIIPGRITDFVGGHFVIYHGTAIDNETSIFRFSVGLFSRLDQSAARTASTATTIRRISWSAPRNSTYSGMSYLARGYDDNSNVTFTIKLAVTSGVRILNPRFFYDPF